MDNTMRGRSTTNQFMVLIDFIERHGDMKRSQLTPYERLRTEQLWYELTEKLNSVDSGCRKSAEKWKKVWTDFKSKTKKKAVVKLHKLANGDGTTNSDGLNSLTPLEQRVLKIIGFPSVNDPASYQDRASMQNYEESEPQSPMVDVKIEVEEQEEEQEEVASDSSQFTAYLEQSPPRFTASTPVRQPSPPNRKPRGPIRRKRRIISTPAFERVAKEFARIEERRVQLEEKRERRLHEREMRKLESEAERNNTLKRLCSVAESYVMYLQSKQ